MIIRGNTHFVGRDKVWRANENETFLLEIFGQIHCVDEILSVPSICSSLVILGLPPNPVRGLSRRRYYGIHLCSSEVRNYTRMKQDTSICGVPRGTKERFPR